MTLTTDEMWAIVEAHYHGTKQRFNFKPKEKDIKFLYDELQKFKKTAADFEERRFNQTNSLNSVKD